MTAPLYLHPRLDVVTAALTAYDNGQHLEGGAGLVRLVSGRDEGQRVKALKAKALRAFNKDLRQR